MKTRPLIPILAVACIPLGGCSLFKRKAPPPVIHTIAASPVSGTELDPANTEKLRQSETLRAYPMSRYIDPRDPNLMHEAHIVYRKETPAAWNLAPHAPTVVPLGPMMALSDPAEKPQLLPAEVEQKMAAQNRLMAALIEQNETLTNELSNLRKEVAQLRNKPAATTENTTTTKQP
ncbi:hypothetical protein M2447_002650 [Ereboglobus sp. PH5-10]|uniref:hypothetical protein n=1 Tax=Ereboglobus sp. PH5-10 TaxID=2940629 RepID=UPI0024076BFA|nr:hypothetical protein [Ereboglobus sp. PH5-10]MDF9828526.1 hypothetical protein [Ereboglobus sp. PH5-10]